jgi:ferredoxin
MKVRTMVIDGQIVPFRDGDTVLDVARREGIRIPTLCFNPLIEQVRSGACRLCMVEITQGGRPGLQSSCTLPASDGLTVLTNSESVFQERRTVIELLLSDHVQDCRNCPRSGECFFADMCREYDINGVPVCAECPNQKDGCLLSRGVLCLGPLTYGNCDAFCTKRGYRCEGCHSTMVNEDILRYGLAAYRAAGFTADDILREASVFSQKGKESLMRAMKAEGMTFSEGI